MKNLFEKSGLEHTIDRIKRLKPDTQPQWGKMNVAQMLAHSCISYEIAFNEKEVDKPGAFGRLMLNLFVKSTVIGTKPYSKNGRTAPYFIVADERDFEAEKDRLIQYLNKTYELGASHFEGMESVSFGAMTSKEWNTMFSKHLEHHLTQFGV